MRTVLASAILCLALALGCGRPPAPSVESEKVWPTTSTVVIPPEITVREDHFKSGGDVGFQHRGVSGIWNGPQDEERLLAVVKGLYEAYAREIEEVDPDATVKRVRISLFEPGSDWPFLHAATDADGTIEPWPPATFDYPNDAD